MPHCDTVDGPVVMAAKKALETGNLNCALIWIPESAEGELRKAFEKTLAVRKLGKEAEELADYWFWETTVRLHREGEGEGFTGLKPEGLSEGPVVPKADENIRKGAETSTAVEYTLHVIKDELMKRYHTVVSQKDFDINDVQKGREYIEAYINFVVYTHHLCMQVQESSDENVHEAVGGHGH